MSEYNLQALAAMDDCEHATGKTLEQHIQTPREIISDAFQDYYGAFSDDCSTEKAAELIAKLRACGWHLVQVVSTGNKPFG